MNGRSAVADSGIASLIHHVAIHQTSPADGQARSGIPPGAALSSVNKKPIGPSQKQMRLAVIATPQLR